MNDKVETSHPSFSKTQQNFHKSSNTDVQSLLRPKATSSNFSIYTRSKRKLTEINVDLAQLQMKFDKFQNNLNMFMHCGNTNNEFGNVSNFRVSEDNVQKQDVGQHQLLFDLNDFQEEVILQQSKKQEQSFLPQNQLKNSSFTEQEEQTNQHNNNFINIKETAVNFKPLKKISQLQKTQQKSKSKGKSTSQNNLKKYNMQKAYAMRNFPIEYFENVELLFDIMNRKKNRVRNIHSTDGKYKKSKDRFASNKIDQNKGNQERERNTNRIRLRSEEKQEPQQFGIEKDKRNFMRQVPKQNQHLSSYLNKNCKTIRDPQQKPSQSKDRLIPVSKRLIKKKIANTTRQNEISTQNNFQSRAGELTGRQEYNSGKSPTNRHRLNHSPEYVSRMMQVKTAENFSKRQNCVQRSSNQVSSEFHFVTPLTTLRNTEADEEKQSVMQGIEEVKRLEPYQVFVVEIDDKLNPILSAQKRSPLKKKPYQYSEEQSFLKKINQNHPRKSRYCQCCAQAHDDMLRTPKKQKIQQNKNTQNKSPITTKLKNSQHHQQRLISRQLNSQPVCICNNRLPPHRQVNQDPQQHSLIQRNLSNNQSFTNRNSHQKLNTKSINFNSHNIPKTKSSLLKIKSTTAEEMMALNKPEYEVELNDNETNQRSASEKKRRLQELAKPSRVNQDINKATEKLEGENRVVSRQKSLRRLSNKKNVTTTNSTENTSQNKVKQLFTVPPVESFLKHNHQQHSTQNIKKLIRKAIPTHLSQEKRIKDVSREVVQMKQFSQQKENDSQVIEIEEKKLEGQDSQSKKNDILENEIEEKQQEGQECNKVSSEQEDKKIQQQGNIETMKSTLIKKNNLRQCEEKVLKQQKNIQSQQEDSQILTQRGEFIVSGGLDEEEKDKQDVEEKDEMINVKRRQHNRSTFNPNSYIKNSQQHNTGNCNQVMKKEDNYQGQQSNNQLQRQNKHSFEQIKEQQTYPNFSNQQTPEKVQQQLLFNPNIQNKYQVLYQQQYQNLNQVIPPKQQHFINTSDNHHPHFGQEQQQYSNLNHHHQPKFLQEKLNPIDQTKTNPNYQEDITNDKTDQQLFRSRSREQTVSFLKDIVSNNILNQKKNNNSSQFQLQPKLITPHDYNQYQDNQFIKKSINGVDRNKQEQLSYNIQIVQQEVIQSVDRKHNTPRFNDDGPLKQCTQEKHGEQTGVTVNSQIREIEEDKAEFQNIQPITTLNNDINTHLETKQSFKEIKRHSSPQTKKQPILINQNQSQRYYTQNQQLISTPQSQSSLLKNNKPSILHSDQTHLQVQNQTPQLTQHQKDHQLRKQHKDGFVQKDQHKIEQDSSEIKGTQIKGIEIKVNQIKKIEIIGIERALACQKQYPLTYQNEKHLNFHGLTEIVDELEIQTDKGQSLSLQLYDVTRDVDSNKLKVKGMDKQLSQGVMQEIQKAQRLKNERILSSQQQNQELNTQNNQSQDSFLSGNNVEYNRDVNTKQYKKTNQNQQRQHDTKVLTEDVNLLEKSNYFQHRTQLILDNHSKQQVESIMSKQNTYSLEEQGESPSQSEQKLSNTKLSVHLIEAQPQSIPAQQQEQSRSPLTKQRTIHPITSHINRQQTSISVLPDLSKIQNLPSDPHFPTHSHLNNKLSQLHLAAKSSQQSLIQITLSNITMEESGDYRFYSNQINQIKSDEIQEKSVGKSQYGEGQRQKQEIFQNQELMGKEGSQSSSINPTKLDSSQRQNQLKSQVQNCQLNRVEQLQDNKQGFEKSLLIRQKQVQQRRGENFKKQNNELNEEQQQNHEAIKYQTSQFSVKQMFLRGKFNSKSLNANNRGEEVEQSREQKDNRLSQGQNDLSIKDLEQVNKIEIQRQTENIITQQAIQVKNNIKSQEAKDSERLIIKSSNIQNYQQKIWTNLPVNKQNSINNINLISNDGLEIVQISEEDYLVEEYLDQLSSRVSKEFLNQIELSQQRVKQLETSSVKSEQQLLQKGIFQKRQIHGQLDDTQVYHQSADSLIKGSLNIESRGNHNAQAQLQIQAHPIFQSKLYEQKIAENSQQEQILSQKTYLQLKKDHEKDKQLENIESKTICVESASNVNNLQTSHKDQFTSKNTDRKEFNQMRNSVVTNQCCPLQNPKKVNNSIEKIIPSVQDNLINDSETVKQIQSKKLQQENLIASKTSESEKPFETKNPLENLIVTERPNLSLITDTVRSSSDFILEKQAVKVTPCNSNINKGQDEQHKYQDIQNPSCELNKDVIKSNEQLQSQIVNPTHTEYCDPTLKMQVDQPKSQGQKINQINPNFINNISTGQGLLERNSQTKLQQESLQIHQQQSDKKSKQRVSDQLFQRKQKNNKQTPILTQQAFTQVENQTVNGNQNLNEISSRLLPKSSTQHKEKQFDSNNLKLIPEIQLTSEKPEHNNSFTGRVLESDFNLKQNDNNSPSQKSAHKVEQPSIEKQLAEEQNTKNFNTKDEYQINYSQQQKHSDKQHQHIYSSNKKNQDTSECPECLKYAQYHQQPQHYHHMTPFMNPYMMNPFLNPNQFINPYLNPMSHYNPFIKNQKHKHKSTSRNNDTDTDSELSSYDQDQNQFNQKKHKKLKQNLTKRSKRDKSIKDKVRQNKYDFDDWQDDAEEKFGFDDESISGIMKSKRSKLKKQLEKKEKSRNSRRQQVEQSSNSDQEQLQQQQLLPPSDSQQQTIPQSRSSIRQKRFSMKASIVNYITNPQLKPIQKIKLNPLSAQQDSLKFDREFKMALRLLNFIDPQHQFIKRLLEVSDTTQRKILWLFPNQLSFKPQSTFQPFEIIDSRQKRNIQPTEIKPRQVADYINLTITKLQQSFPYQQSNIVKQILQIITGSTLFNIKQSSFNKLKNLHKHENIKGFTFSALKKQLYEIIGSQQVQSGDKVKALQKIVVLRKCQIGKKDKREVENQLELTREKLSGEESVINVKWQDFLKRFSHSLIGVFGLNYQLRAQHFVNQRDNQKKVKKNFVFTMSLKSSKEPNQKQKQHCLLNVNLFGINTKLAETTTQTFDKTYDQQQGSRGRVLVYQELHSDSNQYKYIGSGDLTFISMRVREGKYLVILQFSKKTLQNMQQGKVIINYAGKSISLTEEKWTDDYASIMTAENTEFIKTNKV